MRPSHLTINLSHLAHNFGLIRNFVHPAKITAVVKANAYGHGLIPCAKCFEKAGADFIGVAFIEEGIELRDAGITCPIIALAGISGRQAELFLEYDIDCVVSSISKLIHVEEVAKKNKKKARIHLKIDTGMGRIGVHYQSEQLPGLIARSINSDYLECIGISTHLSESESEDTSYTGLQIERFHSSLDPFINDLSQSTLLHVANSGATLSNRNSHLSMVRPGRILYGIPPAPHLSSVLDLKPCLSLKSEVVYFKVAKK
jgi:alanine racemase